MDSEIKMTTDPLGDRMKAYEGISKTQLTPKVPVIIRLDGKAFHTFCRQFEKPYSELFHQCMWDTAKYLCENIHGCQLAYTQSDEITLLLIDYQTETTNAWFEYQVQKVCSVAAAMATRAFIFSLYRVLSEDAFNAISERRGPEFDARCWNLPLHEVLNCFIWRQNDASRNSISMLAQSKFSHKQLNGKKTNDMQDMLMLEHGINWNDCPIPQKRGACIVKEYYLKETPNGDMVERSRWSVDKEIPIFTKDREYINRFVYQGIQKKEKNNASV